MPDVVDFEHHIGAPCRPGDREIAAIAARQHGLVSRDQLLELGLGRGGIRHRLATGRLHRVHVGVYAVGHNRIAGRGRSMAAVLACGASALLSHRSAAALWGLRASSRSLVDVTVPGRSRRGRSGIDLHRVRQLDRDDHTVREAIPVTTIARTLLDVAEVLHPRELARAFEEAERLRLLDLRQLAALRERSRGRRGLKPLGAVMEASSGPPPMTRSELERRFVDLCSDAGLPPPAVNVPVAGFEVDAVWPHQRLIVELDGHAFHRTRLAFERDRDRDAALLLAGYRVLRLTHRRLTAELAAVVDTIRTLLEREHV